MALERVKYCATRLTNHGGQRVLSRLGRNGVSISIRVKGEELEKIVKDVMTNPQI